MGKRQKRLFPVPLLLQGDEEVLTDDAPGKGIYPAVVSALTKRVDDNNTVNTNTPVTKGREFSLQPGKNG